MDYQNQILLQAIKTQIIHKYITPIINDPKPKPMIRLPFEVYQYDEQNDYQALQEKIRKEILYKFNQHIYENELSKLKIELFSLQQAIQMEKSQIAYKKIQIEAQRLNIQKKIVLISQKPQQIKIKKQNFFKQTVLQPKIQNNKNQRNISIYPCVFHYQIEVQKSIPNLLIPSSYEEAKNHQKSHRQLMATYTKLSFGSSQDLPQGINSIVEPISKPIVQKEPKKQQSNSLQGLQKQISFLQRCWDNAKKEGNKKLGRQYKKQLMNKIDFFWKINGK